MQLADAIIGSFGVVLGIGVAARIALAAKQDPKPVPLNTKVFVGSILGLSLTVGGAVMQELALRLFQVSPVIDFKGTVSQVIHGACIFLASLAYLGVFQSAAEVRRRQGGEKSENEQER